MFPGQGAQKVGMGQDLAERFPEAKAVFELIDDALGTHLSKIMWEGPEEELTLTHNAQPAILAHSMAVHALVKDRLQPMVAAGHSLGEYSAHAAVGALSVEDAARLVRRRGELMLEAGKARAGTMAAVLGLATDEVEAACKEAGGGGEVAVPANLNAPDQTVISGDPGAVERAGNACKAAGARRVLPLTVSGAFHSPLMEPARKPLADALKETTFHESKIPVVANAKAQAVQNADQARALLDQQLVAPVRWVECMIEAESIAGSQALFVELGPGKVLAGLLKRIIPGSTAMSLGTAEDVETFLEG